MAETLPTLIKLAVQKVEEKQQHLAQVDQGIAALVEQQRALDQAVKDGYETASKNQDPMLYQQADGFARRSKEDKARLDLEEQALKMLREKMLGELRALFAEQKRYEVLWDNKQQALKKKRDDKQQEQLDETANARTARMRQKGSA